jgi:hypothetical protein
MDGVASDCARFQRICWLFGGGSFAVSLEAYGLVRLVYTEWSSLVVSREVMGCFKLSLLVH